MYLNASGPVTGAIQLAQFASNPVAGAVTAAFTALQVLFGKHPSIQQLTDQSLFGPKTIIPQTAMPQTTTPRATTPQAIPQPVPLAIPVTNPQAQTTNAAPQSNWVTPLALGALALLAFQ